MYLIVILWVCEAETLESNPEDCILVKEFNWVVLSTKY